MVRKFKSTQSYHIERLQSFRVVVFFETTFFFAISCGTENTIKKSWGSFQNTFSKLGSCSVTLETRSFMLISAAISNSKVEIKKKRNKYEIINI